MQDFSNFFANFNSQDSMAILFIIIVSFLLGLIIGLLLRGAKISRQRREIEDLRQQLDKVTHDLTETRAQLQKRNQELQVESREKVELMDRAERLENEKRRLYDDLLRANRDLESAQLLSREQVTTIDGLQARLEALENQPPVENQPFAPVEETTTEMDTDVPLFASDWESRMNRFENRLSELEAENERLRQEVMTRTPPDGFNREENITIAPVQEEPELVINPNKEVIDQRIVVDRPERDDLTCIEGIGPFLEKKLNSAGVYTYEDIAAWDEARIREITDTIEYIPGRIEKDQWVEQARELLREKEDRAIIDGDNDTGLILIDESPQAVIAVEGTEAPEVNELDLSRNEDVPVVNTVPSEGETTNELELGEAAGVSSFEDGTLAPGAENDLKVIEGVNSRVETILISAGINSYRDLALSTPAQLRAIIQDVDEGLVIHSIATWPLQARLAGEERWDELRDYQLEIKRDSEV